jgi:hypothetical protein
MKVAGGAIRVANRLPKMLGWVQDCGSKCGMNPRKN